MDDNVEQNRPHEEGTSSPSETVSEEVSASQQVRVSRRKPAQVSGHEKDQGPWKYRPWQGHDHWTHEKTGASTFDLKKIK